jgi:glycosyltransferase involved in cell wall biosynthesis
MSDSPQTGAPEAAGAISYATWQDRQLALLLARLEQLSGRFGDGNAAIARRAELAAREAARLAAALEKSEAATRELLAEKAALARERERQLAETARLRQRLEELQEELEETETAGRAEQQRLREEIAGLRAAAENHISQNQELMSRAAASAYEAASLRRLVSELLNSLSWKITAPLRFVAKPLFAALAGAKPAADAVSPVEAPADIRPAGGAHSRIESLVRELRRAQSIAVIPCGIPFSSTFNQRPIALARHLADRGTTVVYVAWQWSAEETVPQAGEEVYPRVFQLPLYEFQEGIGSIAAASQARSAYVCTLPSPGLVEAVHPLRAAGYHIHYDIMDDWEEFHRAGEAPWFSAAVENEMIVSADTVTAVSEKLARKFDPLRSDIVVLRNGYQPSALACEAFLAARAPLAPPKTIGYFGHLSDAWFDWDAVLYAAQKLPDVEFELIGSGISDRTRERAGRFPNIRFAGVVPQADLQRYVTRWWAAMIPFRPSAVSAAVDPLKIYEYLHFGLPSIVTGISGISGYPLTRFADSREAFAAAVDAVTARPDENSLAAVRDFLKDCVWAERFARLETMINERTGLPFLYRSSEETAG